MRSALLVLATAALALLAVLAMREGDPDRALERASDPTAIPEPVPAKEQAAALAAETPWKREVASPAETIPAREPLPEDTQDSLRHPRVKGRFVRNDGTPWSACTVQALAMITPTPARPAGWQRLEVGDGGRFQLELRSERPAGGSRKFMFMAQDRDGAAQVVAYVPLDEPPGSGDLGDVVFDHGPLLVAGRVVDQRSQPIAGARFQLTAATRVFERESWRPVRTAGSLQSAADGGFALFLPRGELPPGPRLRLTTEHRRHLSELQRECARGEPQLIVVLGTAGGMAGSLALADGLGPADVLVLLSGQTRIQVPVQGDGTFDLQQLTPGEFSLRVQLRNPGGGLLDPPAATIDGLVVVPGTVNQDPRIQRIPVARTFSLLQLRVVDRRGAPVPAARARLVDRSDTAPIRADARGVCHLRADLAPFDVEICAYGFRPALLRAVQRDTGVTLGDGLPVRLRAGARAHGVRPSYQLFVIVYELDSRGLRGRQLYDGDGPALSRFFDPRGELELRFPAPGLYEATPVAVVIGDDHIGRGVDVKLDSPLRFTVLEATGEQSFDLGIPQQAIDAAVARSLR